MAPDSAATSLELPIAKHESYVKADLHNALLWLALGDLYHQAARFEEAVAAFERSLIESPERPAARSRIALVRISQHRFSEAEAILLDLLRAEPDSAALLYNLGLAQFYQDKWREAQQSFDRALALGLKTRDNLAYLTRSLHHLGKMPEAIEFCNRWLGEAQDDQSKGYLALLEMDDGNMPRARELAQNVLRREPENPRAWLGLGLIRLYEQKHAEAIAGLEKAVSLMPDNSGTIVALGWARLAARDARGAERTFRQAVAVDRNFAEAHGGLASTLALQARVDEAQQEVRVALRLDRAGFGASFARAVLLKIRGKEELAKELLAKVLQQAPAEGAQPLIEHLRIYGAKQLPKTPPPRSGAPSDVQRP